ncbi:MAG: D-glycerate dehydrogenase [candidate division NC10 bacterium]|nr:D-glycerate dehydrogenase [candidate division NC10 bacterium]
MTKPKVFVSRMIPQAALDMLSAQVALEVNTKDEPLNKAELASRLGDKEGLVCLLTDTVDDEVLGSAPALRAVSNVAVGYDNIDVRAATRRKIAVTNTPGVLDETTADFTWALLMATARRVVEADRYARAGKFQGWGIMLLLGQDVHGKTLGICGMGRIGKAVARRARGFSMKILYTDVQRIEEGLERELGVQFVEKETLLRESDFVTLHVPLLPETTHYISRRELALMKKTSHLINASRGPVVDEDALVEALKSHQIAGAALDVFEQEPKIHPGLVNLENVVLAPHIASASVETRTRMATMAAENMIAALKGKIPPHIVNAEIYQLSEVRKEHGTHGEK